MVSPFHTINQAAKLCGHKKDPFLLPFKQVKCLLTRVGLAQFFDEFDKAARQICAVELLHDSDPNLVMIDYLRLSSVCSSFLYKISGTNDPFRAFENMISARLYVLDNRKIVLDNSKAYAKVPESHENVDAVCLILWFKHSAEMGCAV